MTEEASQPSFLRPNIVIPFILCALIWGSTWFVIKDQLGTVPPAWSVTWRFALAAAGMFAFALWRRERLALPLSGHLFAACFGLAQFCLNFNLVYRAELYVTSGIVAVLFALLMLPNALFARILLGQAVTRRFLAGTGIALAGIALLLAHEARIAPPGGHVGLGIGLTAIAILSASVSNVMQAAPVARAHSTIVVLAWGMLWGASADFAAAWALAGPPVLPMDVRYLAGVAYLGIVGSVVTFPMYIHLIRELGAGRAAYNGVVVPIIAMGLSTLFEDYRWSWLAGAGAALALVGLVVALRARSPSR